MIGRVRRVTSSSPSEKPPKRTLADIEHDLAATRQRFTATLDELSVRTQPDQLGKDVSEVAQSAVEDAADKAKDWAGLGEDSPGPRPQLVGALAGAALAILILIVRSRRSSVTYEFVLPNKKAQVEGIVVRAKGRKIPAGIGGQAV